jgi:hypothetical protein
MIVPENKFDVCQFCGRKFEREEPLAIHIMQEHGDLIGSDDDEKQ